MKKLTAYLFFTGVIVMRAQQTTNYVQYIFAKGVINPAASGTNINQKYYYTFGANRQWVAFDNAPKSTFGNFSFTIRPKRSYSYWQNIGATVERDQSGIMANNSFYASYTIHLLLRKNLIASFGVLAGFRKFLLSPGIIDPNDPVMQNASSQAYAYPDLIPGFRLSNKKFFFDIAARQVSALQQQDPFTKKHIGSPSHLNPSLFIAYGQLVPVSERWIMMPSVSAQMSYISLPVFNPTLMFYYSSRMGIGVSCRNLAFATGIFQVRILENLSIGLSYSYSTNQIGAGGPNSYEIMLGVAPMGISDKSKGRHSVAKCPTLDF